MPRLFVRAALLFALVRLLSAADGAALYKENCAACHDGGADRAPNREALRGMPAQRVLDALESGAMVTMASRRTAQERRAIAEYVSGKALGEDVQTTPPASAMCPANTTAFSSTEGGLWNGWGVTLSNTRFQDAAAAGFSAGQVPRLKLKWAFGFPGDLSANAQPVIAGGRVFVGSDGGVIYSLSASTGCIHWYYRAASTVRAAMTVARIEAGSGYAAFAGDRTGNVYALDAATGKLLWKTKVDNFPLARVTGSPQFLNGRLYVPVASGEEGAGSSADYECCKFRGSLVALDAANGKQIWKTYTIDEEPHPTKKNKAGTQLFGPSGAPIWSAPTIDAKGNKIYVTTGDNYSDPPTRTSDAFLALDLATGKLLWSRQMTPNDAYVVACRMPDKTNCPDSDGPDVDFSSSPILVNLPGGKRALVAGQKSGVVHAIDPDQGGEVLWQTRVGEGGSLGGVQWGSAADSSNIYVALSDVGRVKLWYSQNTDVDPKRGGGMFALRLDNGKRVWYTPPAGCGDRKRCSPAQSAAVSALPGVAFSGSVDGHLRAYSTSDGSVLWDFDTAGPQKTVNGVPARGGSLDGPGPAIGAGMLLVESGYAPNGGMPGNVLLAFSVDGN
ncbi:MAG TPA: PQQ-binding-like beta-propeller repeat protein [Bryobacteraceae bacterium]|nr:PQQ-binding-like beta-propeller repeat protein [Bryobacteraceae bacterium]